MQIEYDPFRHHPELRELVTDPETSFFRTFRAEEFFAQHPDLTWVLERLNTQEVRDASRLGILGTLPHDEDLWVFAYGSLMWDPAIRFAELRRARVADHARRFILKDIFGARGTPEQPGLMAALDRGPGCEGLVLRIAREHVADETEILWRREMLGPGYIPTFMTAETEHGPVRALGFVANHEADSICGGLGRDAQVHYIATGQGRRGTSLEYLANICAQFEALGIVDEECTALLDAVRAHVQRGQAAASPAVN